MKNPASWRTRFLKLFFFVYFLTLPFYESSCATASKNKEIDSGGQAYGKLTKNKKGKRNSNQNNRKTLSGHGKVAGDSFLKK